MKLTKTEKAIWIAAYNKSQLIMTFDSKIHAAQQEVACFIGEFDFERAAEIYKIEPRVLAQLIYEQDGE